MIKKLLVLVFILLVIAAVGLGVWLYTMDFFKPVKIIERPVGPITFVYAKHTGDYSKVGPVMDKVYNRLVSEFGIKTTRGMGIYFDNPKTVRTQDLRSEVGCILDGKDAQKAAIVMTKMPVKIMFKKNYCTATFPYKNKASIILGIMKVYPEIGDYMKTKGYQSAPAIEIYDLSKKTILYAFEIKK